jgi:hypothetical protein
MILTVGAFASISVDGYATPKLTNFCIVELQLSPPSLACDASRKDGISSSGRGMIRKVL